MKTRMSAEHIKMEIDGDLYVDLIGLISGYNSILKGITDNPDSFRDVIESNNKAMNRLRVAAGLETEES
jgi:hypothetical protein